MVAPSSPLILLAVISTVVGIALAAVVWRQRDASGAVAYTALMLLLGTWSALYAVQLLQPTVGQKYPWLVVRHAISPAVPMAFWVFVARYTDRGQLLTARYVAPIVAAGLVLAPLPLLDPGNLYWAGFDLAPLGAVPVLEITFGPLFWCMLCYIVLVVGVGHALVVGMLVDSFAVYRRQLAAVAASGVVGFGLLAMFLTDHLALLPSVNPAPNVQLLSYATVLVLVPLGWSYYRDALFDAQPLAHRTVVGNMDDAVFVLDRDGIVRNANDPARRLVAGGESGDLVASPVEMIFADRPALLAAYRDRTAGGARHGHRTVDGHGDADGAAGQGDDTDVARNDANPVAVRESGTRRYYDVRLSTIDNAAGDPIGRVIAVRDVTERARQRERLERKNEQLERLADVVAHDMRTPLSTAEKLTTLLERDLAAADVDGDVEADLADLEAVHDRLGEFADHLPQLARESTDVESPVECDLATVAKRAWAVVDTGDLSLAVESTTTLRADPRRLEQALQNLFANVAAHATRTHTAADTGGTGARALAGDESATTVRVGSTDYGFSVRDDGPGIPPERRDRVFEYGVSSGDGSGFGLAIVRTIVEAHGWTIEASESADGGARFEVRTDG